MKQSIKTTAQFLIFAALLIAIVRAYQYIFEAVIQAIHR
jgi:hypothetical protein